MDQEQVSKILMTAVFQADTSTTHVLIWPPHHHQPATVTKKFYPITPMGKDACWADPSTNRAISLTAPRAAF